MTTSVVHVSVLIPVYGVERYIEQCARSLFEQTMQDGIEFVFIDDCSPDNSVNIVKKVLVEYPHRKSQVKIIHHMKNQGIGGARATGMKNVTGEYIIHCDSDDWVEPDMYKKLYDEAVAKNADIIGCDYWNEYGKKHFISHQVLPTTNLQCISGMLSGNIHCGMWSKLVRKSIYSIVEENGSQVFRAGINMWEDVYAQIQLMCFANNIAYVPRALYHYRKNNVVSYTYGKNQKSLHNMVDVICGIEKFLLTHNLIFSELNYKKLMVKFYALSMYSGDEQRVWASLYPEANKSIMSYKMMPITIRLALLFVRFRLLCIFNVMRKISRIRTKVKVKLFSK